MSNFTVTAITATRIVVSQPEFLTIKGSVMFVRSTGNATGSAYLKETGGTRSGSVRLQRLAPGSAAQYGLINNSQRDNNVRDWYSLSDGSHGIVRMHKSDSMFFNGAMQTVEEVWAANFNI
jgi:hypothetical protein